MPIFGSPMNEEHVAKSVVLFLRAASKLLTVASDSLEMLKDGVARQVVRDKAQQFTRDKEKERFRN